MRSGALRSHRFPASSRAALLGYCSKGIKNRLPPGTAAIFVSGMASSLKSNSAADKSTKGLPVCSPIPRSTANQRIHYGIVRNLRPLSVLSVLSVVVFSCFSSFFFASRSLLFLFLLLVFLVFYLRSSADSSSFWRRSATAFRNSRRSTLPTIVLGSMSRNSTSLGSL